MKRIPDGQHPFHDAPPLPDDYDSEKELEKMLAFLKEHAGELDGLHMMPLKEQS